MTRETDPTSLERSVLPPPDPAFNGRIEVAFKDSEAEYPEYLKAPAGAPNVLLVMGDDIGYGHMSAFGGPANTPTFDRLAAAGLIFSNFHTTPVCAASRACLLTGRNAHTVAMGGVPEISTGFPGYNSNIPRSAATVLDILRQNGYGTAWIGKTHLTPIHEITLAGPFDRWPRGMGTEYFYGFFGPGVSQWHPPLWENTHAVAGPARRRRRATTWRPTWPTRRSAGSSARSRSIPTSRGSPTTRRAVTSRPSGCRASSSSATAASSTTATTSSATTSWRGRRSAGSSRPTPSWRHGPAALPAWSEISDVDKKVGARWMEVFCAAVEYTDHQVGRLVEAIEETGELDNTIIVYIAGDNGPTPEGGLHGIMNKLSYWNGVPESLDDLERQMDDFGSPGLARLLPRRVGLRHGDPVHLRQDRHLGRRLQHRRGDVLAGAASRTRAASATSSTISSTSSRPSWTASASPSRPGSTASTRSRWKASACATCSTTPSAQDRHTTQYFELTGARAIYHDGWWAGTRHGLDGVTVAAAAAVEFDDDEWELYDMRTDFGHANNLAADHPDKLAELQALFDSEARQHNVYPMANDFNEIVVAERPRLVTGDWASYGPGTIRLPEDAAINIKNRSFALIAEVENPTGDAEGMLVTIGGETGGYAMYVLDGKPTFTYNWLGRELYTITADRTTPHRASARSASSSPTTAAAPARAAPAPCRSTARTSPRAESNRTVPGLLLDRRHLRRRRGLGHPDGADLRTPVHLHRQSSRR